MDQEVPKDSYSRRLTKKRLMSLPKAFTVEENDDDSEMSELQVSEEPSASDPRMTQDQLMAHYGVCMRLAAENKITIKNAFSLNLIDLLKYVIKYDDKEGINFSAAGSVISASTKIYSCRVDNLYSQVIRLLGEPQPSQDKQCVQRHNKKYRTLVSGGQLQRLSRSRHPLWDGLSAGSCLLSQFPLTRPSEGVVLHQHRPFWPDQCGPPDRAGSHIDTVTIRPHRYAPKPYLLGPTRLVRQPRPSLCQSHEEAMDSDHVSVLPDQKLLFAKPKDRACAAAIVSVDQLLLRQPRQSDYHYLDTRWFMALDTPSFWYYPTSYSGAGSKSIGSDSISVGTITKKNPRSIVYNDNRINVNVFNKKWRLSYSYKTLHWKQQELLFVDELKWEKDIRRLFCCNLLWKGPKDRDLSSSDDDTSEDAMMISPSHCSNVEHMDLSGGSDIVDVSRPLSLSKSVGQSISKDESSSESSLLEGDRLVPAPKTVVVPQIYYTLKPKRINMKELKEAFWLGIQRERLEEKEKGGVMFWQLLQSVKSKMAAEDSDMLSWQLAMACVLHIASDRLLELKQADSSDFSIHPSTLSNLTSPLTVPNTIV